jgi:hypothetical protein
MRVPRTRGVLSGLLLVLLGAWGALIAFVGPYFNYAYTPDSTWTYTSDRLWMQILPGAGTLLGGLIVLGSAHRAVASFGAWLAAICGAWFVVGPVLAPIGQVPNVGTPTGGITRQALESLGFFYGLGVAIVFFAALALGRFSVVGIRETRAAEREEVEAERLATMDNSTLAATGPASGFTDAPTEPGYREAPSDSRFTNTPTASDSRFADPPRNSGYADAPRDAQLAEAPTQSTVDPATARAGSRWHPGSRTRQPDPTAPVSPATADPAPANPSAANPSAASPATANPSAANPSAANPSERGAGRHADPATAGAPANRAAGEPESDRTTELPPAPPLSEQREDSDSGFLNRIRHRHHAGASSGRSDNS